jgi:NAD(P)-dependent dehydrogenase (short-subunit alcohol dehydrogenase family)
MAAWSMSGKVILISGGARGIGAATARELARRGAVIVLANLDGEGLTRTAAAMPPVPLTIELDVTDVRACEAAVERVLDEHGRLDVVWANAGIASGGPVQLTDPVAWTRTVGVNLLGSYYTVRAWLRPLSSARAAWR